MRVGSLCSGIGGIDLALESLGMETTWFVEYEKFCQKILKKHWPSTPIYGDLKKLTSSLPVSPVSPSVSQVSNKESQTQGTSGPRFSEPSLIYDPLTRSLRTCQVSLLTNTLEPYSETYMKQGTMRNGAVFPRKKLAHHTRENDFSSWPTPDAYNDPKSGESAPHQKSWDGAKQQIHLHHASTMFTEKVEHWMTPTTMDTLDPKRQEVLDREANIARKGRTNPANLRDQVSVQQGQTNWPTPRAREGNAGKPGSQGSKHNAKKRYLDGVVQENWPTPTSAEASKIGNRPNYGQKGLSNHPAIVGEVERTPMKKSRKNTFPTPTVRDWKGSSPASVVRKDGTTRMSLLDYFTEQSHFGPQAPQIQKDGPTSSSNGPVSHQRWSTPASHDSQGSHGGGQGRSLRTDIYEWKQEQPKRLNPMFVSWLMGLEPSWTELPG
jgi:hypothetical protein